VHRGTGLPINGRINFAQRFAIDWMLLDSQGRFVEGDPKDVHSYADYGASVLAVADGTVISTLDTLDDQIPGALPNPKTITLQNVDGNHIVIDLGGSRYAFYAHLKKNSLLVHVGDHVKKGQVLAKLGNTGNTSGPHLHFHVMDGPSVLGSSGIPYIIDNFSLAGQVSVEQFNGAPGIEGDWGKGLLPSPTARHNQYPLNLNIVNFQ
jgi:murein DD-endopeptidase MepM/ murein hydrolase activator NlpD